MNPLILQAVAFGVSAGTSFGPLQTLLMNVTLARGWRTGLLVAIAPLISDTPIIVLMLLVMRALPPAAVPLLNLVGGIAIFIIAYGTFRSLRNPAPANVSPQSISRETIIKALTVGFLSPGPYIYWGTISGPLFIDALNESVATGVLFMLAFYGVFIGILIGFVILFDRVRTLDPRVTTALRYLSLGILVFLGTQLILRGIDGLRV